MALHAYYYPNLSVCKIIAEPLSYLPPTTAPSYQKTTSSSLTQIGRVDLAISDNGMSYIIQLEDGSFILIDGGNSNITDAVNLFQFMVENTPGDSKPVIAAWIFSHPHGDHINLPVQFFEPV